MLFEQTVNIKKKEFWMIQLYKTDMSLKQTVNIKKGNSNATTKQNRYIIYIHLEPGVCIACFNL